MASRPTQPRRLRASDLLGLGLFLAFLALNFLHFASDSPLRMARKTMGQLGTDTAAGVWSRPDFRWKDQARRAAPEAAPRERPSIPGPRE